MKIQKTLPIAAALLLVAGAAIAMGSRGPGGHGGRGRGGVLGPLAKAIRQLDLTDAQRSEIRSLVDSRKDEARTLREKLRDERRGRREERQGLRAGAFDEAEFRADFRRQAKLREDLAVLRAKTVRDVLAKLTPSQRDELEEMREARRERRGRGRGMRGERNRGWGGGGAGPRSESPDEMFVPDEIPGLADEPAGPGGDEDLD